MTQDPILKTQKKLIPHKHIFKQIYIKNDFIPA
jgi:hypothetical protein